MSHEIAPATMRELRGVLLRWAVVLTALGAFALWATWRMSTAAGRLPETESSPHRGEHQYAGSPSPEEQERAWYRCTMPECGDQGSPDPDSRCPVCGMKRERVDTGGGGTGGFEIKLSERARRLAEVETEPAQKLPLFKRIRTVGRVGYDETRYKTVSAWIGGRIDKLFADFTGMTVNQGDHLVEIYSPELLSAQEEYLRALQASETRRDEQTPMARRSTQQVLAAARRKLELLGVTDAQIASIEHSGEPRTRLVVHAPIGGTIVRKHTMEGMYVKTGDVLYTIADLTHLWLLVELYETDLPWVKPFQEVLVTTRSMPGEVFTGQIVFVEPTVDPQTRTVQVRIHVDNPAMRLKPDMWLTAQIDAGLSRGGRGAVPAPDGDYACPMHPWETAHQLDSCPVCAMDMVRIEDLPQYTPPTEAVSLLSVPRGAVMQTGQRALVYVEMSPGIYRGAEVTVGPLARGNDGRQYYPILAGLSGGERVVTRGNFAIDSQMQLAGKPSLFAAGGLAEHKSALEDRPDAGEGRARRAGAAEHIVQTHCPVMGGKINPKVYIEYKGVKVYFCCWGCDEKFLAQPEKYIPKLPSAIQARLATVSGKEADDD